jgi:hypothetical protein
MSIVKNFEVAKAAFIQIVNGIRDLEKNHPYLKCEIPTSIQVDGDRFFRHELMPYVDEIDNKNCT